MTTRGDWARYRPSGYESVVDRRIREAQERGDFDDLPGTGRPLPGYGETYDEDWWIKDWIRRENITGLAPASLRLRREVQDVLRAAAGKPTEAAVRELVADLNERIHRARQGLVEGPPVALPDVDADKVVAAWRAARGRRGARA